MYANKVLRSAIAPDVIATLTLQNAQLMMNFPLVSGSRKLGKKTVLG
jgi:hypothetical protein